MLVVCKSIVRPTSRKNKAKPSPFPIQMKWCPTDRQKKSNLDVFCKHVEALFV